MRGFNPGGWRKAFAAAVSTLLVSSVVNVTTAGVANAASVSATAGTTTLVSSNESGAQGAADSHTPAASTDGRYVAFISDADLLPIDTNGVADVYRRDLGDATATSLTLASVNTAGTAAGNAISGGEELDISDDGSKVFFRSDASDLVSSDTNAGRDLFVRDYTTGTTERVNVPTAATDNTSVVPGPDFFSASADGNKIAFIAYSGLPSGQGVYLHDRAAHTTNFVHQADGAQVALSGDGGRVAFSWSSSGAYEIYYIILSDPSTSYLINFGTSTNFADPSGLLGPNAMSNDGNIVAFWSDGDAYPATPGTYPRAVYAYDHSNRPTFSLAVQRMSELPDGTDGNSSSGGTTNDWPKGAVSSDGNVVVFTSQASNLDPNAPNGGALAKNRSTKAIVATSRANLTGDTGARAVSNTSLAQGALRTVYATSSAMLASDTNGASDIFESNFSFTTSVPAGAPSNLSLTASTASTYPGFTGLASDDVPVTALPLDAMSAVAGAPLRSIDLATSPLRSIPLRSIPLRSIPLRSIPLRSITLSEIPLANGTWEAILATIPLDPFKGVPLQNISLDQVLDAPGMATVSLGDVDLSSTPLRSISISSILLGATPLRSIKVGTGTDNFADWCTILTGLGYSCADLGITQDSTVLALDLAGVPLRSIPLRSIPLRSIPLRSIDVGSAPLRSIPLRSISYATASSANTNELGDMDLTKIRNVTNGVLGTANPGLLVNCADADAGLFGACSPSRDLNDAFRADAFLSGKTFGDLADHVDPADLTGSLGDLIAAVIDTSNYPWETLPLDGLQPFAGAGAREITYTAHFEVIGAAAGTPATVSVDLPTGFLYKEFSTVNHDDSYSEPQVTGQHLVWTISDVSFATSYDIVFDAYPGFELGGPKTSTMFVTIAGNVAGAANQAPVTVFEDMEGSGTTFATLAYFDTGGIGNNFPATSPIIGGNTMIASHIGTSDDVDYYRLPVPPKGTRIQIRLGNHSLDADFDVAMINGTSSTPLRSIPLRSIPLRSIPLTDNGVDATAADSAVSPETLNDIPGIDTAPLRSIGENRGTQDELIATVSDADPLTIPPPGTEFGSQQYYLLQVTAYNSGRSNAPYVLYVKEYAPPAPPECPSPKAFAHPLDTNAGTAPSSLPTGLNTLFLVDQKRMSQTFGNAAAQSVIDKLTTLAGQSTLGVTGVVYPVDGNAAANTALNAWDQDPCNPGKANTAFRAVADIVDSVRADRPTLKNIVVVGGDDIIPMARVADYTQISNESDYATETMLTSGTTRGTPLAAAQATQNILTDDPLGDVDPIAWLDHRLYVPDLAVGRMVETPAEINAQVDQFIASQGKLNPQTSLTTGYDFLADGSQAVDQSLANRITDATKRKSIVNETWSKADEIAALYPATGGSPDIASLNAHYDHTASLPALGNSTNDLSDLVTTDDIASHPNLTKRLLFTMGCHAGLSVPASYTDTAAKDKDWAQTYSSKQAAVYFANTGFGYGDTAAVALSEEVMRQFAKRLDGSMTVGEAAIYAKQAYFGQLGAYGPYDEKAMQEATFYGLPMWKVGDGTSTPAPVNVTPAVDATGVKSAPVSISSTFVKKTSKGGGQFYEATAPNAVSTGLQVTQYRPIEPRLSLDVTPTAGNGVAHGVLVTSLASQDEAIVPAMARPVIDLTANEPPPPAGDVSFPTTFQNLTAFNTPQGQRQHVVFMPGQFFRDASWSGAGGVQRKFTGIGAEVKYSDSTDFLAPQLTDIDAVLSGGNLTISLIAYDEAQDNVKRVLVMVKDGTGAWSPHALTVGTDGFTWSATFPVSGTQFEYFAQAQDGAGNVGVTTNKGRYFSGIPQPLSSAGTPNLTLTPGQPTGSNGWYKGNVSVSLNGTPGVSYTKSVDGGAPTAYSSPVPFSADGSHSVKAFGSNGSSASIVAVIDKTAPTFTVTPERAPNANGWYNADLKVTTACSDATSGVQVCPASGTISTEGLSQKVGTAFDFAGNANSGTGFNIDKTGPVVTIGGVTNGAVYNGVAPDPTCTVTDPLSGPDGCVGSLAPVPNNPGFYSYVAVGRDKAGNFTTVTATFKALYLFGGFLQPVNDTAHQTDQVYSVFAGGSTVPLKFQLKKPDGTFSTAQSTPTFTTPLRMGPLGGVPVNEPTVTTAPTPGNLFTYDASSKSYSYNWKTDKKTMTGYYWKVGVIIDGQTFMVIIGLK
jgi:hypothetical protein